MKSELVAQKIVDHYANSSRLLVAIAGPPGSGKSTLAGKLSALIRESGIDTIIVPMDGFHLDNVVLDELGLRNRKGSPETFDAGGFIDLIQTISENEQAVRVPEFDRGLDSVVVGKSIIEPSNKIILVEGNYLLLNEKPWVNLSQYFDMKIFINPGLETLKKRLIQRWLDNDHSPEEATKRALLNDIPNAERVLEKSVTADILIES